MICPRNIPHLVSVCSGLLLTDQSIMSGKVARSCHESESGPESQEIYGAPERPRLADPQDDWHGSEAANAHAIASDQIQLERFPSEPEAPFP